MKQCREKFSVIHRDGDNPDDDSDEKYSYNFAEARWNKIGITRFAAHNIMEIACDSLLYVVLLQFDDSQTIHYYLLKQMYYTDYQLDI